MLSEPRGQSTSFCAGARARTVDVFLCVAQVWQAHMANCCTAVRARVTASQDTGAVARRAKCRRGQVYMWCVMCGGFVCVRMYMNQINMLS